MWGVIITIVIVLIIILLFGYAAHLKRVNRISKTDRLENLNTAKNITCCRYKFGPDWYFLTGYPSQSEVASGLYRLPTKNI